MGTPQAHEVLRRTGLYSPKNIPASLSRYLFSLLEEIGIDLTIVWPNGKYASDPVGFAHDILGLWLTPEQAEVLEAIRDNQRVAVSGGRKCGKDFCCAIAALWWYCSFENARVIMTAPTARQVDGILWRDIRNAYRGHGLCLKCKREDPNQPRPCAHSAMLDGLPGKLARTGLVARDLREIVGFTSNEAEAIAGVSGSRLMYIIDEASGVDDSVHTAIRGNLASENSREVMISNPTRNQGKFYDAFHSGRRFYKTIFIDTENGPNIKAGKEVVPGLASSAWLEMAKLEWGAPEGSLYLVHVKGVFAESEEGKCISIETIANAQRRWHDATGAEGTLRIGVDPSSADGADESTFAVRRGNRILRVYGRGSLNDEGHLVEVLGLIKEHRYGSEEVTVAVDSDGIGYKTYVFFLNFLQQIVNDAPHPFRLVRVRGSEKAQREPMLYDRLRDEVWGNLARWLREGGAIPESEKLQADLHEPEWLHIASGRIKMTAKEDLRKQLGRSPDYGDAVALAVWEPIDYQERAAKQVLTRSEIQRREEELQMPAMDPYEGLRTWQGGR